MNLNLKAETAESKPYHSDKTRQTKDQNPSRTNLSYLLFLLLLFDCLNVTLFRFYIFLVDKVTL